MKKSFIGVIIGIIVIGIILIMILTPKAPSPLAKSLYNDIRFLVKSLDFQSTNFSNNAKLIALEISSYNETEIKDYPLSDLSSEEITEVFNQLDYGNVSKVLSNMSRYDINEIKNQLSDNEFNNILNRLLPNERNILIKNMNYTSNR